MPLTEQELADLANGLEGCAFEEDPANPSPLGRIVNSHRSLQASLVSAQEALRVIADGLTKPQNPMTPAWAASLARMALSRAVLAGTAERHEPEGAVNYSGTDSVECAYEGCTNRLQRADGFGPQWCSREHRAAALDRIG